MALHCTRLVSNVVAPAGMNRSPAGNRSLGPLIKGGEAIPGDPLYHADEGAELAYIDFRIGGGQAGHGGFNGHQIIVAPADLESGPGVTPRGLLSLPQAVRRARMEDKTDRLVRKVL